MPTDPTLADLTSTDVTSADVGLAGREDLGLTGVAALIEMEFGVRVRVHDGDGVVAWTDGPAMNEVAAQLRRAGYPVHNYEYFAQHEVVIAGGTVTLLRRITATFLVAALLRAQPDDPAHIGSLEDLLDRVLCAVTADPPVDETELLAAVLITDQVGAHPETTDHSVLLRVALLVDTFGGPELLWQTSVAALR